MDNETKSVVIKTRKNIQLINPEEIICCISNGREVEIILKSNECIKTVHNMKQMVGKLKNYKFLQCHARYLVNLNHRLVFDLKKCEIELINKEKIVVAKDRRVQVNRFLKGKYEN